MYLAIVCSQDGFWRAGKRWTKAPTIVEAAAFEPEQLEQLHAEAKLNITACGEGEQGRLVGAILQMAYADKHRTNANWWTDSGAPEVNALRAQSGLGKKVTAKARDAAYVALLAL